MLVHLLKVHAWPHSVAAGHWPGEILSFQADVAQRYLPSMRQRIDLARLYGLALRQVAKIADGDGDPVRTPDTCPFMLEQLPTEDSDVLEARLRASPADPTA